MRRQRMKQPRGPAKRAMPRPPISARARKSWSMGRLSVCVPTVAGDHLAMEIVAMIVVVLIDREPLLRQWSEQGEIFRMGAHRVRLSVAANMLVEADHAVGRRYHDMQIVGHHEDAAAEPAPQLRNQV